MYSWMYLVMFVRKLEESGAASGPLFSDPGECGSSPKIRLRVVFAVNTKPNSSGVNVALCDASAIVSAIRLKCCSDEMVNVEGFLFSFSDGKDSRTELFTASSLDASTRFLCKGEQVLAMVCCLK
jgi:hypothetical protein